MIMFWIGFAAGTILGGAIDLFVIALLSANKEDNNGKL